MLHVVLFDNLVSTKCSISWQPQTHCSQQHREKRGAHHPDINNQSWHQMRSKPLWMYYLVEVIHNVPREDGEMKKTLLPQDTNLLYAWDPGSGGAHSHCGCTVLWLCSLTLPVGVQQWGGSCCLKTRIRWCMMSWSIVDPESPRHFQQPIKRSKTTKTIREIRVDGRALGFYSRRKGINKTIPRIHQPLNL